jgi:hypothetical protein
LIVDQTFSLPFLTSLSSCVLSLLDLGLHVPWHTHLDIYMVLLKLSLNKIELSFYGLFFIKHFPLVTHCWVGALMVILVAPFAVIVLRLLIKHIFSFVGALEPGIAG